MAFQIGIGHVAHCFSGCVFLSLKECIALYKHDVQHTPFNMAVCLLHNLIFLVEASCISFGMFSF